MEIHARIRLEASKKFYRHARAILGLCAFEESPTDDDMNEHVDLSWRLQNPQVSLRVQKHKYFVKFGHHVTFRVQGQNAKSDEFDCVLAGTGANYFLSGFEHEDSGKADRGVIGHWQLLDLRVLAHQPPPKPAIRGPFENGDGSGLVRINCGDYPDGMIMNTGNGLKELRDR